MLAPLPPLCSRLAARRRAPFIHFVLYTSRRCSRDSLHGGGRVTKVLASHCTRALFIRAIPPGVPTAGHAVAASAPSCSRTQVAVYVLPTTLCRRCSRRSRRERRGSGPRRRGAVCTANCLLVCHARPFAANISSSEANARVVCCVRQEAREGGQKSTEERAEEAEAQFGLLMTHTLVTLPLN